MEVEISSNVKFFEHYPRGREARSWGNIGAFRSLELQSTAKIFLMRELMGEHSQRLRDVASSPRQLEL